VHSTADAPAGFAALQSVTVPDVWQQQAVSALREGRDVVVQAPTGSGKTLVFELWSNFGRNRGQAIYTVPTRALANDKLAEWRARGWNAGIATGDLAENLSAPVLVATLETQKNRLIAGDGPSLLVVDEYQMIADEDRGLNYEIALALAPSRTQLLLLSGSVANPHHVVQWLTRLGRKATLIRHEERPVPLEEVSVPNLQWHLPAEIRSYWPRFCAKALAENLGPILLFAPRRQHAEEIAAEIARQLPTPVPLRLSDAQRRLVGEHLARMLKSRVAYHHSGLSYGARAGVIEPLAKAGQLRVVVATMGLAAGINFSLRSVALTGHSYRRDGVEVPLRSDELLQMFGRAGRRGIDETGYLLVGHDDVRLREGHAAHLARSGMVDWNALLGLMTAAAEQGRNPFAEAVRVQERLFTTKPIVLGVEESLKHPVVPCGLHTDSERARHVRQRHREMVNSRGEWQPYPHWEERPLREIRVADYSRWKATLLERAKDKPAVGNDAADPTPAPTPAPGPLVSLRPILTERTALEKVGRGELTPVADSPDGPLFGRAMLVADRLADGSYVLTKWVRRLVNWTGRQTTARLWRERVEPALREKLAAQRLPVVRFDQRELQVRALVSLADHTIKVPVDSHGVGIWRPHEREVLPSDCAVCSLVETCRKLPTAPGTAVLWRRLGLVDPGGVPTRRGQIVSFFHGGDGLAIAAALEDERYPLDEFIYDLANLDASFRFAGDGNRWEGRLVVACRAKFGMQNIPGYLEMGVPSKYGFGAETVVRSVHRDPFSKYRFVNEITGDGDIDRVIIEWRSLLRQIAHAPKLEWPRWTALQQMAKAILHETESPTMTNLPPLEYDQNRRLEHGLSFRRH
jgi:superfamily II DNA/RNA helicase